MIVTIKVDFAAKLAEQRQADWVATRAQSLRLVPHALEWARHRSERLRSRRIDRVEDSPFRVRNLTDSQRRQFFQAMFPSMADIVEQAWHDTATQPIAMYSWECTPVRLPESPQVIARSQEQWFFSMSRELVGLDPDPAWLAKWGGHFPYSGIAFSTRLLSTTMDMGGPRGNEVFQILADSAANTHEIGVMGDHVIAAMLDSARPEAWDFVIKLLLAAQRQEGLRSAILERTHMGHPGAFRRVLRTVHDENLIRFAATIKAINTWFGIQLDSSSTRAASAIIHAALTFLDDPKTRDVAVTADDPIMAYVALWCMAYENGNAAARTAESLLSSNEPQMRWIGLHALSLIGLPGVSDRVCEALLDPDMRVAARAKDLIDIVRHLADPETSMPPETTGVLDNAARSIILEQLEALLSRIEGKAVTLDPFRVPLASTSLDAADVGRSMVNICPPSHADHLIPHLKRFDSETRSRAIGLFAGIDARDRFVQSLEDRLVPHQAYRELSPAAMQAVIELLGDPSPDVRRDAGAVLAPRPPTREEVTRHEALMERSARDIRIRACSRLLALPDDHVLACARRLLGRSEAAKLAGLELLSGLIANGRVPDAARALAEELRASSNLSQDLEVAISEILHDEWTDETSTELSLGLAHPFTPRPVPQVRSLPQDEPTPAAVACIWSLNELVEANKTFEVAGRFDDEYFRSETTLLGSMSAMSIFDPSPRCPRQVDIAHCPVHPLLEPWLSQRLSHLKDADELELVRAWMAVKRIENRHPKLLWPAEVSKFNPPASDGTPFHHRAIEFLLTWALRLSDVNPTHFFLDQIEGAIARSNFVRPENEYRAEPLDNRGLSVQRWYGFFRSCPANWPHAAHIDCIRRLDALVRAASQAARAKYATSDPSLSPNHDLLRNPFQVGGICTSFNEFLSLLNAGEVSDDELLERFVQTPILTGSLYRCNTQELNLLTRMRLPNAHTFTEHTLTPRLDALIERIRRRVLELEFARGEAQSPATPHAFALNPSGGIDAVVPALHLLGKRSLVRGSVNESTDKADSCSRIILNSRPSPTDTPAAFTKAAKDAGLSDTRLVELALYQPRWAAHVEHALGWEGLEEGVLWLRTHTKESKTAYRIEEDREPWEAKAAELSPISPESLSDGVVDRPWFERCYAKLGHKRWEVLYDAAKYASSSSGHTRARLFADAMLGEVTEKELVSRIESKRHQDAARALGLLAISPGDAGRKQVLARYKVLQEMRRTSRKHGGSMLQASEKRAVEIAMENLAWTAGYPDPLRLQWAMEIEELGDLAKGPVSVKVDQTEVTLSIDDEGTPSLTTIKAGKPLKSVPPAIKNDKRVAELAERLTNLRRQGSRIRLALESAMCRGDTFAGDELATLFSHPILKSALSRLILIGTTPSGAPLIGYPDKNGKALRHHDASLEPLKASDALRIAHPLDLLATKQWHKWQADCFKAERVQPFKQIFREIYTPIASELAAAESPAPDFTRRYAGQQIQPRQALALFGSRGWVARPEEGVQRTFHHERVTVHVEFEEGFYTPAEIDGLTLAGVSFAKAATDEALRITDVPPRVFSEVMRDLDLVVSVAHRGEVDPEASQSTVEMRAALIKETCSLLSLANVRIEASRAIIKGELGEYALHLASGTIHKLPGGTIWVIPVHSQHRGRVFLPFADDDPKTAEIISKVLLLARDREIQDPAILAQIRAN